MAIRESFFAPLTEPIFTPEVFATGLVVQRISTACIRLIFYTDSDRERMTVAKIIRPIPLLYNRAPVLLRMADETIQTTELH